MARQNFPVNQQMMIRVNGQPVSCPGNTLASLFKVMKIRTKHVAVVLNGEVVPQARRSAVRLTPGDRVELVTLAGGG